MSATDTNVIISPALGYAAFDSDNHYYESEDAFTRHLPKKFAKRGARWIQEGGKKKHEGNIRLFHKMNSWWLWPVS